MTAVRVQDECCLLPRRRYAILFRVCCMLANVLELIPARHFAVFLLPRNTPITKRRQRLGGATGELRSDALLRLHADEIEDELEALTGERPSCAGEECQ